MKDDRKTLGTQTEQRVKAMLEKRGYIHLASNWRFGHGELDLVMLEGEELVFVEVKARRSEIAGRADEGVNRKQARILLNTAERYTEMNPDVQGKIWRIDLVGVTLAPDGSITGFVHHENAIVVG